MTSFGSRRSPRRAKTRKPCSRSRASRPARLDWPSGARPAKLRPMPAPLGETYEREFREREARSEKVAALIWLGVILGTYGIFIALASELEPQLVRSITGLVAVMGPAFALLALAIQLGWYHPALRFVNTFLQVTLVSAAVFFDTEAHGVQYALSSMPPMAYGLVVIVTAFRLQPGLGLFAGAVAALQFLAVYAFAMQGTPELDGALVARIPSLGWEVTWMKAVVLLALGVACYFAARRLRREFAQGLAEARRSAQLEQTFGRYVSEEVAAQIARADDGRLPTGKTEASVLFVDLRGFTAFSEGQSPEAAAEALNRFYAIGDDAVRSESGILNKFLGDGFLAVFGVYARGEDHPVAAVRAWRRMREQAEAFSRETGLGLRMGLHCGEVIAGEVGAQGRCEFTVIGAVVNTAARLENLAGELGADAIVSEPAARALPPGEAEVASRGPRRLPGLERPLEVYELRAPDA